MQIFTQHVIGGVGAVTLKKYYCYMKVKKSQKKKHKNVVKAKKKYVHKYAHSRL